MKLVKLDVYSIIEGLFDELNTEISTAGLPFDSISFKHGDLNEIYNHYMYNSSLLDNPIILLVIPQDITHNLNTDVTELVYDEVDLKLLFLYKSSKDWTATQHQANSINPMYDLFKRFQDITKYHKDVFEVKESDNTLEHIDWHLTVAVRDVNNKSKKVIKGTYSGVEINFILNIRKKYLP